MRRIELSRPQADPEPNKNAAILKQAARRVVLQAFTEDLIAPIEHNLVEDSISENFEDYLRHDPTTFAIVALLKGAANTGQDNCSSRQGTGSAQGKSPHSTKTIPSSIARENSRKVRAKGNFIARRGGVLAGTLAAGLAFEVLDDTTTVEWTRSDGDEFAAGEVLGTAEGPLSGLLSAERTALNLLCHLSGVATATNTLVEEARKRNPSVVVRDTRKTLPGLRILEKEAVKSGGGANHRLGLYDGILVKDNHIDAVASLGMSYQKALVQIVSFCRKNFPELPIEIEADDEIKAVEAAEAGADIVLCDNMPPEAIARAVREIKGRAKVEASGGIDFENIGTYASTGVDFIAVGSITHSAPAIDISFDITEAWIA